MELINIYDEMYIHRHYMALYNLLAEREPHQNISHKELPTFPEHVKFVDKKPYFCWYGIWDNGKFIGAIYISRDKEIGLFIKKGEWGKHYGSDALKKIMELHKLDAYFANIAPNNSYSIAFFSNFGFKHYRTFIEEFIEEYDRHITEGNELPSIEQKIIQYTYKFTPSVEKA